MQLGTERATHEREVCRWLLAAERLGVAARAGYGAFARGELCFSAVRELTRVAACQTEEAWCDWALNR